MHVAVISRIQSSENYLQKRNHVRFQVSSGHHSRKNDVHDDYLSILISTLIIVMSVRKIVMNWSLHLPPGGAFLPDYWSVQTGLSQGMIQSNPIK